jgi:hypothetical protein
LKYFTSGYDSKTRSWFAESDSFKALRRPALGDEDDTIEDPSSSDGMGAATVVDILTTKSLVYDFR